MYIDAIGYNSEPENSYEDLCDKIEEIIEDTVIINNPPNLSLCTKLITRLCAIHAMQAAHCLGAYDEIVLGVRDSFISDLDQEDLIGKE